MRSIVQLPTAVLAARPLLVRYIASSGALATAAAAQLVTFAILARAFGPKQFGLYIQFTAGAAVAVQLCGIGASDCLMRRVSRQRDAYPALLGHNLIMVMLSGLMLVAVGTPLVHWRFSFDARQSVDIATGALLVISNVVLTRLVLLAETIFLSLSRAADANRAVVGFALARTCIAAVACYALATTTVARWAAVQFIGFGLYAAFCCWWLRRLGPPRWRVMRDEIRPGLFFASQFVARAVRQNIDLFALGTFLAPASIASYGIARRVSEASFLSIDAMNRLLYPHLARASRSGPATVFTAARSALAVALLLGLATATGLFFVAPLLLRIIGRDYVEAVSFIRILSGLLVFIAAWTVAIDVLGACDHHGARALIMNGINIAGSGVVLLGSLIGSLHGAITALYGVEVMTVVISWATLVAIFRRGKIPTRQIG